MYKDRAKRLKWARDKYAKDEKTRKLAKLRTKKRRLLKPEDYLGPVKGDKNFYKRKARDRVKYALKKGVLVKQPCFCGDIKVEAHHEDYSKPLDVIWLCVPHHKERERLT